MLKKIVKYNLWVDLIARSNGSKPSPFLNNASFLPPYLDKRFYKKIIVNENIGKFGKLQSIIKLETINFSTRILQPFNEIHVTECRDY
ncbi:hypothetical protein BpHYR1_016901 [Brachionus plicatilis]|uniref:Uncharacterized protein n=1 Tax=Brachionus plicatilis TaxID=10195 RepID=A0A3M7RG80_BRAPC|nr:hypothetical protein BpHYR1_016901 [Brachionus plicatilis]